MVLQDLGDAPQEGFNDSPYPSDNDPYSTSPSSSSLSGQRFDASSLPQPLHLPFGGFSSAALSFRTNGTIRYAEQKIGRQLTSEEAHRLAYHLYQMEQRKSYGYAAGIAAGAARWASTMAENRYPMYLPKPENVNPNKFMFVKGPNAQWARHGWRLTLYVWVAGQVGKIIGQIWGQNNAARDTATDPKLGQFAKDLKASLQQGRSSDARAPGVSQDGTSMQRGPQQGASQTLPPHAGAPRWGRRPSPQPQPQPSSNDDDDMSPTAGNDYWSSTPADPYGDSGFSSEGSGSPPEQKPTPPNPQTNPFGRRPSRPADNDASHTGGFSQNEAQSQSMSGQSAWDRLRRGAGPTSSPRQSPPHREQREGSTLGDSFTFAESDDERKRAQEQAQREFDQRIERERQGKDFSNDRRW